MPRPSLGGRLILVCAGLTLVLLYLLQTSACLWLELVDEGESCLCTSGHLLRILELTVGSVLAAAGASALPRS